MTTRPFLPIRTIFLLAMLVSCCLLPAKSAHAVADWGEIRMATSPLNVRESRSPEGKYVTTLHKGERVRVHYLRDDWYAVFPPDARRNEESRAIGYARAQYLVPVKVSDGAGWGEIRYADRMLTVRRERTKNSPHVHTLHPGDEVRVADLQNEWYAIYPVNAVSPAPENRIGYSYGEYLLPTGKTPPTSNSKNVSPEPQAAPKPVEKIAPKPSAAPEWGVLRTLSERMVVRAGRSFESSPKKFLRAGDTVRLDFPENGWWAVFPSTAVVRDPKLALGFIPDDKTLEEHARRAAEAAEKARMQQQAAELHSETTLTSVPAAETAAPSATPEAASPRENDMHIRLAPQGAGLPIPTDEMRQGIRYSIFDQRDGGSSHGKRLILRVYVDVSVLPNQEILRDFATTIWKEKRLSERETQVDIYLPGMDRNGLSYATARFTDGGLREFWTRETVLYGTQFKTHGG